MTRKPTEAAGPATPAKRAKKAATAPAAPKPRARAKQAVAATADVPAADPATAPAEVLAPEADTVVIPQPAEAVDAPPAGAVAEPAAAAAQRPATSKPKPLWPTVLLAVVVIAFPWLPIPEENRFSLLGTANLAAYYAVVAFSIVIVTGWVGQISIGQAGLVGIGAYVTGHVVNGWHVTFPVNVLWAAAAGALVAIVLGAVALRVRGLYLAVATLIFSWTAAEFLFRQPWLTRNSTIEQRPFGEPGTFPYFDWTSRRTFYYASWAIVAAAAYLAANLRDSKTGRAFFAVRGSEVAAASLGISVVRTKLVAFAVSGAFAGVAGNLLIVGNGVVTPDAFEVEKSLFFLAIAVVGGLASLGGAIAAALLFALLDELFFRWTALTGWLEVVPPLLLTASLLLYRGGLAAIPGALGRVLAPVFDGPLKGVKDRAVAARAAFDGRFSRLRGADDALFAPGRPSRVDGLLERLPAGFSDRLLALRNRRRGVLFAEGQLDLTRLNRRPAATDTLPAADVVEVPRSTSGWQHLRLEPTVLPPDREDRRVLLEASNVTVRFGGLVAVNDVSLTVREHEIVGLIGPNGAGKTTTFNSVAGLNVPTAGRVSIYGYDVTNWTVDERARLGVGRTFQAIQLLPQLTVYDNLLVATHLQNPSRIVAHLFVGRATLEAERAARRRVRQVAALLELEEYLDREVKDLPFGVLRMVELARALVTGSKIIMLDEPASGLDSTETDRLAEILRFVRDLGVTLLLIEHDVKMVTSVSDYMYVLDHGTLLAEGTPAEVQRDPRVIAAYLGEAAEAAEPEPEMVLS